jgi:hypothetical protein
LVNDLCVGDLLGESHAKALADWLRAGGCPPRRLKDFETPEKLAEGFATLRNGIGFINALLSDTGDPRG